VGGIGLLGMAASHRFARGPERHVVFVQQWMEPRWARRRLAHRLRTGSPSSACVPGSRHEV
jgi:hypothetical protein